MGQSTETLTEFTLEPCREDAAWNHFLDRAKEHTMVTIAHNPSLGEVLDMTFGYTHHNYWVMDQDGPVGVFPVVMVGNKAVSMPHFSYGGPLMANNFGSIPRLQVLLPGTKFEIRGFTQYTPHIYDKKLSCVLQVYPSQEEQLMSLKSKLRQKIRKTEKLGLMVRHGGLGLLDDFYGLYAKKMLDFGSPPIGKVFYKNLLEHYQYGEAVITVLYDGPKVVAAAFSLSYLNFNEICWSATESAYDRHNIHACICWEILKTSVDKRYAYFSFGRSTLNSNNHKFKLQWNPMELPIYYNYSEPVGKSIKELTYLTKIWKMQPLKTSILLGHKISKYVY